MRWLVLIKIDSMNVDFGQFVNPNNWASLSFFSYPKESHSVEIILENKLLFEICNN